MNIFLDGQTNGQITSVLSIPDFYLYSIGVCVWGGGGRGVRNIHNSKQLHAECMLFKTKMHYYTGKPMKANSD